MRTVAALFVEERGPYVELPGVEVWGISRDARLYAGPHPVVAHPPCERWGRYATGGPSAKVRRVRGADGGCFEAALAAVRRWGGVLEHPAGSSAWRTFGLLEPPMGGGWVVADWFGGWTCRVDQGHYGHVAQKATWLYARSAHLPSLAWSRAASVLIGAGVHTATGWRRSGIELLSKRQRCLTPERFRDVLLAIARGATAPSASMQPEVA
jgi:hypothetical protein